MNDQDAAGASLLIVEDDPGLCRQYRWAFPGRTVMLAGDRAGAVEIARREQPQVAIIDLGLPPDPDGITQYPDATFTDMPDPAVTRSSPPVGMTPPMTCAEFNWFGNRAATP